MILGIASLGLIRTIETALTNSVAGVMTRAKFTSRNFATPLIGTTAESTQTGLRNRNGQTNVEQNVRQSHVDHNDSTIF